MHRHRLTEPGSGPCTPPGPCCDADSSELETELWAGAECKLKQQAAWPPISIGTASSTQLQERQVQRSAASCASHASDAAASELSTPAETEFYGSRHASSNGVATRAERQSLCDAAAAASADNQPERRAAASGGPAKRSAAHPLVQQVAAGAARYWQRIKPKAPGLLQPVKSDQQQQYQHSQRSDQWQPQQQVYGTPAASPDASGLERVFSITDVPAEAQAAEDDADADDVRLQECTFAQMTRLLASLQEAAAPLQDQQHRSSLQQQQQQQCNLPLQLSSTA
ncbi:hypothetical protein OEZ86_004971 [Tetradesmus obliquus]|nr:hypothetical protein OEZ86_004971 [Tetradesmus obliquus]WIA41383.1 hypothetical protein OEZ86_004971 [Tetradesmus obliquus]WIA41384.1 hypothetical protein OEZ86_004971 [Tetradesmus obliquus]